MTSFWNKELKLAVVVAQLTDRSLPTPAIRSSNPTINKKCSILSLDDIKDNKGCQRPIELIELKANL